MMKNKIKSRLVPDAEQLLICLLTPIVAMLVITAFYYSSLDTYEAARFYTLFCDMLESIGISIVIAVFGSLLLDLELRHRDHSSSDKS